MAHLRLHETPNLGVHQTGSSSETEYQIGALLHRERITINRYTGKIENLVVIGNGELVHHGLCKQLPGRMF